MSEFLAVLSFSAVPFVTALLFSAVVPPLGATLYLRNEVLLGLALPPAGSAVLALAVLLGIPPESKGLLFGVTAAVLFLVTRWLPLGPAGVRTPLRKREMALAALFVGGNALTLLFMALSSGAHAHLRHLLNGELLSVTRVEFFAAVLLAVTAAAAAFRFRGAWFAFSLDEEALLIQSCRYPLIRIVYRLLSTILITAALMLIGPLLCTALLVIPALFAEKGAGGLESYFRRTVLLGMAGTLAGLAASLVLDLPPSYVSAVALFAVAAVARVSCVFCSGRRTRE